jgi:hypothetical protein
MFHENNGEPYIFHSILRYRENICLRGQSTVKSVVKHHYLGDILAEDFTAGVNTLNMGGIVKRSKVAKAFDSFDNLIGDEYAFIKQ